MEEAFTNVIRVAHLVSATQYAKAAGIQPRSVYLRQKRGILVNATVDELLVIDSEASVPLAVLPRKVPKAEALKWPVELPSPKRLIRVRRFCRQHDIRNDAIYTDIILGRLKAYCIAEEVFVEENEELMGYVTHQKKR